jgi:hypothetical protein
MRRVLNHAAIIADGGQGCGEAPSILAKPVLVRLARCPMPIPAPTLARGMGNDRVRAVIGSGIAGHVPRVNSGEAAVCAIAINEQGCDHRTAPALIYRVTKPSSSGGR